MPRSQQGLDTLLEARLKVEAALSDDNGGHAGVHHVGISSIVISMLIDDTFDVGNS